MTEISTLGEFGLIDHLTADMKMQNESTLLGVGDDCAVLKYSSDPADNRRVLVTTDMLMEGIHFDLTYTPLKHLGYKAAMVNLSDVYAKNILKNFMRVCVWLVNVITLTLWEVTPPRHLQDLPLALLVLARRMLQTSYIAQELKTPTYFV